MHQLVPGDFQTLKQLFPFAQVCTESGGVDKNLKNYARHVAQLSYIA